MLQRKDVPLKTHVYQVTVEAEEQVDPEKVADKMVSELYWVEGVGKTSIVHRDKDGKWQKI